MKPLHPRNIGNAGPVNICGQIDKGFVGGIIRPGDSEDTRDCDWHGSLKR